MSVIKVAILGFGTVGKGVYQTIQSHADELQAVLGKKVEVAAVLIKNKHKQRNISQDILVTTDFADIIELPQLDIVVEAIVDKDPTYSFLQQAIRRGCHIITANKEMFAHYGKELLELAAKHHVSVGFEATVAGGIPVIQTLRQLLNINNVNQVQGILNGTSNFILSEMREKKQPFAEALRLAQENGFAEADPTNDVEGFDAFYKTMILSRIAFGAEPNWHEVEREGITKITSELIEAAEKLELRFKHVARIERIGTEIKASVKLGLVGKENPFYHVEGVQNAVNVHSDIVGRITLQGPGAGMYPTASAVIEDLVYVCQNHPEKRSFSPKSVELTVQESERQNELWYVHGISGLLANQSKLSLEYAGEDVCLVWATKSELEQLVSLHTSCVYFPIIGEYELNNEAQLLSSLL